MAIRVEIVGGGLMGLSAAFHLRRADPAARVTVRERGRVGGGASGASAAGVRAMGRDPAERALALASLARWPELDRELEAPTRYRRTGGLRLALDEAAWRAAGPWAAEQQADGVAVEVVDAAGARALAPGIAPGCLGGVYAPDDGQAEAGPATEAFARAARRLGARVEEGAGVRALLAEGGRVVGIELADGGREGCDVVIVAAGAWSAGLLAGLGVRLPIETRPLQMLLTEPGLTALGPVLSAFDRPLSLKQLEGGGYLIGGGWPARVTDHAANRYEVLDESVAGSLAVARAVFPPVGACALAGSWAGLEAFTPDGLPVLGALPGPSGLLVAAGFSGHGFALSPVIGDILARLTLGSGLTFPHFLRPPVSRRARNVVM